MAECGLCNEPLGDLPQIQLPCTHRSHSQCFLANLEETGPFNWRYIHCAECDVNLFPENDHVSVGSHPSEETRIENLLTNNRNFKKDLKYYMHAKRSVAKPLAAFRRLIATKKAEVAPVYAQIKAQYQGLSNMKKDEIQASDEYKVYRRADARFRALYQGLLTKYNLHRGFYHSLRSKPGFKTFSAPSRWRDSPSWMIRRTLRLRLRM